MSLLLTASRPEFAGLTGVFVETAGNDAGMLVLQASAAGAFALSGGVADFEGLEGASTGNFVLTGTAGTRVLVPALSGAFTETAGSAGTIILDSGASGTFTLTGGVADFEGLEGGSTGVFTLSGAAGMRVTASATSGAFTETGGIAGVRTTLPASAGAFTLTGGVADFEGLEGASTGIFVLSGGNGDFVVYLPSASGVFVLTMGNADALHTGPVATNHFLIADTPGVFLLTMGNAGALAPSRQVEEIRDYALPLQLGRAFQGSFFAKNQKAFAEFLRWFRGVGSPTVEDEAQQTSKEAVEPLPAPNVSGFVQSISRKAEVAVPSGRGQAYGSVEPVRKSDRRVAVAKGEWRRAGYVEAAVRKREMPLPVFKFDTTRIDFEDAETLLVLDKLEEEEEVL